MRLAVVLPSRGVIHSRTIEAVLRETAALPTDWTSRLFIAHGRPIPDCFNEPTARALAWGARLVWFVEEDMALPVGILGALLAHPAPFVAADYPAGGHPTVHRDQTGTVLWTGTGCLLATAHALTTVGPFTTDHHWVADGPGWRRVEGPSGYGGHEVNLGMAAHAAGTPVQVIDQTCGQYTVTRHAAPGTNTAGWHDVHTLTLPARAAGEHDPH